MRLGCEVTAIDLKPVAWLILNCTLEYPQRLAGQTRSLPDFVRQDCRFLEAFFNAQGLTSQARVAMEAEGYQPEWVEALEAYLLQSKIVRYATTLRTSLDMCAARHALESPGAGSLPPNHITPIGAYRGLMLGERRWSCADRLPAITGCAPLRDSVASPARVGRSRSRFSGGAVVQCATVSPFGCTHECDRHDCGR